MGRATNYPLHLQLPICASGVSFGVASSADRVKDWDATSDLLARMKSRSDGTPVVLLTHRGNRDNLCPDDGARGAFTHRELSTGHLSARQPPANFHHNSDLPKAAPSFHTIFRDVGGTKVKTVICSVVLPEDPAQAASLGATIGAQTAALAAAEGADAWAVEAVGCAHAILTGGVVKTESKQITRQTVSTATPRSNHNQIQSARMCRGLPEQQVRQMQPRHRVDSLCCSSQSSNCSEQCGSNIDGGEIHIGPASFEPTQPALLQQLVRKLGVSPNSKIEAMQGFSGGLNEGIWFLRDPQNSVSLGRPSSGDLVLKLVKCKRIAPSVPTEAENILKVAAQHPSICGDLSVAFPVRVFSCMGPSGKRYDLIVMERCRGKQLAEIMATKWHSGKVLELLSIFEHVGRCVAAFHQKYGNMQHGDLQPSNIFFDEELCQCTLIDVGGIGIRTAETDAEHFGKSLKLMGSAYGPQISVDGVRHYLSGYARGSPRVGPTR